MHGSRTHTKLALAALGAMLLALAAAAPAGAAWTRPAGLSAAAVPVELPPVSAIDADGDSYHVWINKDERVEARTRKATGALGPTLKLSQGGLEPPPAEDATVGVNGRGDALFAWKSMNLAGTQNQILCRYRTAAGALGPIQTCLSQSKDAGDLFEIQVALDADGDAVIAWHQEGVTSQVLAKTRAANGRLGATKVVSGAGEAFAPQVEMDNGGEAVFVWQQDTPNVHGIVQTRVMSPTGVLGRAKTLATPEATEPDLSVNATGDAAYVWLREDAVTGKQLVEGRYMSDADVLSQTQRLTGTGEASLPQVGLANNRKAAFGWLNKDLTAGKFRVEGRTRSETGRLGPTQSLSSATQDAFDPHLGVDADGDALFVWHSKNATTGKPVIESRKISSAGALAPVATVAQLESQPYDLDLAVAANGKAAAIWRNTAVKQVEASFGP